MVRFLISIPNELKALLKNVARTQGQTLNGLIRQILWDWVERHKQWIDTDTQPSA